jgi:hypothetical protein
VTERRARLAVWALGGVIASGCSLGAFEDAPTDRVANHCGADTDCNSGEHCARGACYSDNGKIDDALFEIVPDAASSLGGLSFLSPQSSLRRGDGARNFTLSPPVLFTGQVRVLLSDLGLPDPSSACTYVASSGMASVHARVDFFRTNRLSGTPVPSIAPASASHETQPSGNTGAGGWNFRASLVSGSYDIYVQPVDVPGCPSVAPYLLRNIEVGAKIDASAPPATLDIPAPIALKGTVTRPNGSLVGWSVELVEPIEGRVISTSKTLGETAPDNNQTNFDLTYHPVAATGASVTAATTLGTTTATSPLIRITPPKGVPGPTVYWSLAAADLNGVGQVRLDMSGVPTPSAARRVGGRVQGSRPGPVAGVPATVVIFSSELDGTSALTASWGTSRHTDGDGYFFVEMFGGEFRVIAIPDPSLDPSDSWAITEAHWSLHFDATMAAPPPQTIELLERNAVTGHATAGRAGDAAIGATLEAVPSILTSSAGVLRGALGQIPVSAQSRIVSIDNTGAFAMSLDPGDFDFSLQPPEGSGFAWWVKPAVHIDASTPTEISPRLASPVAIEGTIRDAAGSALANAVVRAYARTPSGIDAAKVGSARTDGSGSYQLLLPQDFGP